MPDLPTAFGKTLRRLRQQKGWSQMKVAQTAGLHLNALGSLERGERTPNLHTVFALSNALGIQAADLIADVEKQRPSLGV